MAIVEYNMVSPEAFNEFVPKVTVEHQNKKTSMIMGFIIVGLIGIYVYTAIKKDQEERSKFI